MGIPYTVWKCSLVDILRDLRFKREKPDAK